MADNEVIMENGGGEQEQFQQNDDQEQPMEEGVPQEGVEDAEKKDLPRNRPAGRTVIIKNLPPSLLLTLQDVLKEKFEKYGDLQYVRLGGITIDFDTVVPTLAAYINYTDPESSEKAMAENGTEIDGYSIQMQILKTNEHTMVVSNVPYTISEDCIWSLFSSCGNITKVIKIPARPTVFVEFETDEGLQQALSLNGTLVVNNIELLLQKQGEEKKPLVKPRKMKPKGQRNRDRQVNTGENNGAVGENNGHNFNSAQRPKGNRIMKMNRNNRMGGAMGMMGNNRNWGGNMSGWGMGYNNWDNMNMNYNNSWGNGNNYGGGNNGPRGNKRRKNEWRQY